MTDGKQYVVDYANSMVKDIEEGTLDDVLTGILSIETYKYGYDGSFKGAELLMAMNGPTAFIDTEYEEVKVSYGEDRANRSYKDNIGIGEHVEELAPVMCTSRHQ